MIRLYIDPNNSVTVALDKTVEVEQPHKALITFISNTKIRVQPDKHELVFIFYKTRPGLISTNKKDFDFDLDRCVMFDNITKQEIELDGLTQLDNFKVKC